jgi:outer membrane protein assembly factor BamE
MRTKKPMPRPLVHAVALIVPLIAGCSSVPTIPGFTPYKMEIQQGNFVDQDMVSRLKPGMSRDQVRFILGTPLVADVFHGDRWDYVFSRRPQGGGNLEQRRLSVFFEDNRLKRVDGDVVPAATASEGSAR